MTLATSHDGFTIDHHVYRRRWWILAVLCTSLMIVIIGNTSLNVALPTLARELDASTSAAPVDGRRLRPGVRRHAASPPAPSATGSAARAPCRSASLLFLAGALAAPPSPTPPSGVIVGRAVMGLGAAFVMPSTLSILTNVFPAHERTKAIAIWAGISGAGAAIGPIASRLPARALLVGLGVPRQRADDPRRAGRRLRSSLPTSQDPEQRPLDSAGRRSCRSSASSALVYAHHRGPAPRLGQRRRRSACVRRRRSSLLGAVRRLGAARPGTRCSTCAVQRPPLQRGVAAA